MTTVKPPPPAYRSGLCTHGRHDGCRGAWGAAVCDWYCEVIARRLAQEALDFGGAA